ncbi:MAG: M3 family metallopeptidase, partial [Candidatus Dormiibacterota bacterium]
MTLSLPTSPDAFATGDWSQILPYYEELADRALEDIAHWLHDWSALEKLVGEAYGLAMVAYTTDTSDEEKERRHLRWSSEIAPKAEEQQVRLARRLVANGYTEPDLEVTIRGFRNQIALFREESLPLQGEVAKESSAYQRVTGQMLVDWDGETLPVPRVEAKLEETDRALRERAYRAATAPYIAARSELVGIFDRLYAARQQIARQAGFANFRDYQHRSLNRFDYTPDDCLRWHEAVEEVAVPAIARIRERRRTQLGVDRLRPWDVAVDPLGRPPLRPFQEAGELIDGVGRMFAGLDPDLGRNFAALAEGRLLDLDSRPGKAPGGYCLNLPERGSAFIFMNAAGTQQDVFTLLHESGHSFHAFAGAHLPLYWEGECGSEIAEVASMSMELLAGPRLGAADGGFYEDEASVRRARAENLSSVILGLAHIASIDAFQHWIYTD